MAWGVSGDQVGETMQLIADLQSGQTVNYATYVHVSFSEGAKVIVGQGNYPLARAR